MLTLAPLETLRAGEPRANIGRTATVLRAATEGAATDTFAIEEEQAKADMVEGVEGY